MLHSSTVRLALLFDSSSLGGWLSECKFSFLISAALSSENLNKSYCWTFVIDEQHQRTQEGMVIFCPLLRRLLSSNFTFRGLHPLLFSPGYNLILFISPFKKRFSVRSSLHEVGFSFSVLSEWSQSVGLARFRQWRRRGFWSLFFISLNQNRTALHVELRRGYTRGSWEKKLI